MGVAVRSQGRAELHQLGLIFGLVGLPDEESWPGCSQLSNWKATESFKEIFEPGSWAFDSGGVFGGMGLFGVVHRGEQKR